MYSLILTIVLIVSSVYSDIASPANPVLIQDQSPSNTTNLFKKIIHSIRGKSNTEKNEELLNRLQDYTANQSTSFTMAYFYEETIALIGYVENNITSCKLMEVNTATQAVTALNKLSQQILVYPIDSRTMVNLIQYCQELKSNRELKQRSSSGRSLKEEQQENSSPWTFLTAIVPGTKWCGAGDIAESYDDLGSLVDMDKCCRAHDHCPVKVKAMKSAHGLLNLSLYTKSHCACDDQFFTCLKAIRTPMAQMIGNIYFNILQVPCVDEDSSIADDIPYNKLEILPDLCQSRSDNNCSQLRYPFKRKPFKFVNVNRQF